MFYLLYPYYLSFWFLRHEGVILVPGLQDAKNTLLFKIVFVVGCNL